MVAYAAAGSNHKNLNGRTETQTVAPQTATTCSRRASVGAFCIEQMAGKVCSVCMANHTSHFGVTIVESFRALLLLCFIVFQIECRGCSMPEGVTTVTLNSSGFREIRNGKYD